MGHLREKQRHTHGYNQARGKMQGLPCAETNTKTATAEHMVCRPLTERLSAQNDCLGNVLIDKAYTPGYRTLRAWAFFLFFFCSLHLKKKVAVWYNLTGAIQGIRAVNGRFTRKSDQSSRRHMLAIGVLRQS